MWYRVFGYPNRLYTAREILALSLMPNDLISVNAQDNLFGFSEWYVFSDTYIQNLIAKDLGYTVGDDGVIHRTVSQSQTQSPKNLGYSIGDDGVLHKTHSNQHSQYQPTTQTNGSSSNNSFESWAENIGGCIVWILFALIGYCLLNVILEHL